LAHGAIGRNQKIISLLVSTYASHAIGFIYRYA
jgi:hypothetical protein